MVKVRIAPAPTGPFHVGTARSALFNYIFAKKHGGVFILRIEDTDSTRADAVYENDIRDGLSWLGLNWDEFYRESERLAVYKEYLTKLYDSANIFWCSHSKDELARERENQMQAHEAPRHVCAFRDGGSGAGNSKQSILRFKNDRKQTIDFNDIIRGKISFNPELLGDFSVARSLESPLYNFAVVVDDSLMEITHVIRGEDLISSTPKQILLLHALKFVVPEYAHLPLILSTDRSKLSKRKGPTSISQYRKEGYLADAMINFLALLGWHDKESQDDDIFSLEELIEKFELKNVQKSGAIFDIKKLDWVNGEYIRKKLVSDLCVDLAEFLKPEWQEKIKADTGKWEKIVALEQPRLTRLGDIGARIDYFFDEPYILKEELGWKNQSPIAISENLRNLKEILSAIPEEQFNRERVEKEITPFAEKAGIGETLWPMRYALTGKRASPGPFEIADILGKEKTIMRISMALELLAP